MDVPCLNGSVFEAFMCSVTVVELMCISSMQRVLAGSNWRTCDDVYSDTRRNP